MRRAVAGCLVFLGLMSPLLAGHAPPSSSSAFPIAERFLSRSHEEAPSYRAVRRIDVRNPRFNLHGWVEVATELTSDGRFRYQIVRTGGSEYVLDKVVRPLLQNEEQLFATGDPSRSAVNEQNYHLRGMEAAEPGLVKLLVKPRRRDVSLIDGALFVTEREADLVRVEGKLAKNPSFWTKRVDVVRHYSRIAGARVPVRLESIAQIRFAGAATLSITWDYETINGQPVTGSSESTDAQVGPAETR